MSVYYKEKPGYLRENIREYVLTQAMPPEQFVLERDELLNKERGYWRFGVGSYLI